MGRPVVALGPGAEAVVLGRPYVCGLAVDSARAVRETFLADRDLTMGLAWHRSVGDLDRSPLRERDP